MQQTQCFRDQSSTDEPLHGPALSPSENSCYEQKQLHLRQHCTDCREECIVLKKRQRWELMYNWCYSALVMQIARIHTLAGCCLEAYGHHTELISTCSSGWALKENSDHRKPLHKSRSWAAAAAHGEEPTLEDQVWGSCGLWGSMLDHTVPEDRDPGYRAMLESRAWRAVACGPHRICWGKAASRGKDRWSREENEREGTVEKCYKLAPGPLHCSVGGRGRWKGVKVFSVCFYYLMAAHYLSSSCQWITWISLCSLCFAHDDYWWAMSLSLSQPLRPFPLYFLHSASF